jgi:soluble lytic murein transglycosylase-like protein
MRALFAGLIKIFVNSHGCEQTWKDKLKRRCQIVFLYMFLFLHIGASAQFATEIEYTPAQLDNMWRSFINEPESDFATYFPHMSCFRSSAKEQKLPLALLFAVARGESNFKKDAVSKANAIGVMQIQWPGTAKHLGI